MNIKEFSNVNLRLLLTLFVIVGGCLGLFIIAILLIYILGGETLIYDVWHQRESHQYGWTGYAALFFGALPGATIGMASFLRLLNDERRQELMKGLKR
jgi:hypothetical protein